MVSSEISEFGAAHHARDPQHAGRIGDEERVRVQLALHVVEGRHPLPEAREADDDPTVMDGRRVEGVDRLAQLEHDVVAHVHDVAHRALPGGDQAHLDGVRRRPHRHARDKSSDEARAQPWLLDLHLEPVRDGAAGLGRVAVGEADRGTGDGRDLPGEPDHAEGVAAVRLDVDIEDDVAIEVGERDAERRVRWQDQDAVGVGGESELVTRAEHAVAHDAHLFGALDMPVTRQHGAWQGHGDPLARGDVRRAADDLEDLTAADGHGRER